MAKKKVSRSRAPSLKVRIQRLLQELAGYPERPYASAFQFLGMLPRNVQADLISRHGMAGDRRPGRVAATQKVKDTLSKLGAEHVYLSTKRVKFKVNGGDVSPSSRTFVAVYRLPPATTQQPRTRTRSTSRRTVALTNEAV